MEEANSITGGYKRSKKRINTIDGELSVGGMSEYKIRSNILEWRMLKDDSDKVRAVNYILNLPEMIKSEEALCKLINKVLGSGELLAMFIDKSFEIKNPLEASIKTLFYTWKELIEVVIYEYLKEKKIKSKGPLEHPEIKKNMESAGYKLPGYCPHEPTKRLQQLLEFPLEKYIKKDIHHLLKKIKKIIAGMPADTSEPKPLKSKCITLDKCVENLFSVYKQNFEYINEKELHYIKLSKKILKIALKIEQYSMNYSGN
jgi:hypothetical protein